MNLERFMGRFSRELEDRDTGPTMDDSQKFIHDKDGAIIAIYFDINSTLHSELFTIRNEKSLTNEKQE